MRSSIVLLVIAFMVSSGAPEADAIHIRDIGAGLRRRGVEGGVRARAVGQSAAEAGGGVQERGGSGTWAGRIKGHAVEGAKNMVASSVASAVGKTLLQPFDSIKTVQQNSQTKLGMLDAASEILSRGGALSLYSGLGATILGSVPSIAIYFGCYQFFKGQLLPILGVHFSIALSAGLANLFAACVRVPFEIVKQRLQAGVYPDTASAVSGMLSEGGIGAFFILDGMMGQIMRDIPYAIVTLLAYEAMQSAAAKRASPPAGKGGNQGGDDGAGGKGKKGAAVWVSLVTGALAGGLGVSNPRSQTPRSKPDTPDPKWQVINHKHRAEPNFVKGISTVCILEFRPYSGCSLDPPQTPLNPPNTRH